MAEARSTNEKGAMEGSREMVERREGGTTATRRRSFFRDVSIFRRGTERNSFRGRVFIEAIGKWGTISILFFLFLFETEFLENFWRIFG